MRFFPTLIASVIGTLVAFAVLFLLGLALVIGFSATADQAPTVESNSVLDVRLSGSLPERSPEDPFVRMLQPDRTLDLRDFRASLENAARDDRVSVLWLRPRGVGGSWGTLQHVRDALIEFRESGKRVVAFAGPDGFGEKDYFLATAADAIYAPPESDFTMNGFSLTLSFYAELLEKLEIETQVFRAGRYKSAVEPFMRSDMSPENERQYEALLSDYSDTFIGTVSEARDIPEDSLRYWIREEPVYTATMAHEAGLIDSLLFENEVEDLLQAEAEQEEDEDLTRIEIGRYARVPASAVDGAPEGDDEIAVVYANGTIVSGESQDNPGAPFGGGMLGSETFTDAVDEALEDEDVRGIVVRVNSPGGSANASDVMWHAVRRAAEEKPVMVSMGATAASGGYYISAPADTIVAEPLTLTGSIGVFGVFMDVSGLFEEKFGVTFDGVQTSPYADMFSGLRPLRPEEQEGIETYIDTIYATFLRKVAEGRSLSVQEVDSVAQGRVWTGGQAQERGLVDELGGLDRAVELAAESAGLEEGTYRITELPRPEPFAERLSRAFQARAASYWYEWTADPAARRLHRHVETLSRIEALHGGARAQLPYDVTIE